MHSSPSVLATPTGNASAATIGACADYARRRLPREEADLLTRTALGVPHTHLFAFAERTVEPANARRLAGWVRRRGDGEPVAYILGRREFYGLALDVTPAVLIPRADTETLVEAALPLIGPGAKAKVMDLGTGCGAVALALAAERPSARVLATDLDARCIALCRRNAARLGLSVETRLADGFVGIDERFDLIVSNPPYVAADDPHLMRGDLRFEPRQALVGGGRDGLDFVARLIAEAPDHLVAGGALAIEHGAAQGPRARALFRARGFKDIETHHDIERRPRATIGKRP